MKLTGLLPIACLALQSFGFAQQESDALTTALPAAPAAQQDSNDGVVIEPGPTPRITGQQRFGWFATSTFGPASLFGGAITSGVRTWENHPKESGTHWEGFGDRYAVRTAEVATSNAIEASLGAIWGEDPRYFHSAPGTKFGGRVGHVVKWTFMAPDRNGDLRPAYARFVAISSSSFISNAWREPSEDDTSAALSRIGTNLLSRMAGNAFSEFMPDVKRKFFHHKAATKY